jgi:hypothetical protein
MVVTDQDSEKPNSDTNWRTMHVKNVRTGQMVSKASLPANKLNHLPLAYKERENRGLE